MLKNNFKIALRTIRTHLVYSILNVTGMAIGMVCSILILLWVHDEWSYDRHFRNAGNLYRVLQKTISVDGNLFQEAKPPTALSAALKEQFPEVIRSAKYMSLQLSMQKDNEYLFESVAVVDEDFLKMFDVEFIRGDINSSFNGPDYIILTEEMARKYYGNDDPLGKPLKSSGFTFTVAGVVKSFPLNSHLQFDFLVPFGILKRMGFNTNSWNAHGACYCYLELEEGTDSRLFDNKIRDIVNVNLKDPVYKPEIFLQNIKKIHLYSSGKYTFDIPGHGDIVYVRLLGIVAVLIIIIACINFMSLATAQSARRAKEVGMRKITGAGKARIVFQFLGESLLIVLAALALAMILVQLLLPGFNSITEKQVSINYNDPVIYAILLAFVLVCTIMSGSYPAFYLSSLKSLNIINGVINKTGKAGFRRVIVVLQFSLTFMLILCTLVVGNQLQFLKNKDLGLNPDNVGHFKFRNGIHNESLKAELAANPDILNATILTPDVFDPDGTARSFDWPGNTARGDYYFSALYTDIDFAKTFQLGLKDGRFFSPGSLGDSTSLVINEKAAEILGFKDPVGQVLSSNGAKFTIIGVMKDFHFRSLRTPIGPLIMMKLPPYFSGNCYIRMKSENIDTTVDYIKKVFDSYHLEYPLQFTFLDDEYDMLYRSEQRIGKILIYSSILAIIISCMGLVGLSLFLTELRTKEIGLRKVNGAKSIQVFFLVTKEYLFLVLISILIASPVAWYGMNKWLSSYAYRIKLSPWFFASVGLIVLLIALVTVGFQSYKAAERNPVEALRYE